MGGGRWGGGVFHSFGRLVSFGSMVGKTRVKLKKLMEKLLRSVNALKMVSKLINII